MTNDNAQHDGNESFPWPQYEAVWKYGNRLVLRKYMDFDGGARNRKFLCYVFFVLKEDGHYERVASSSSFGLGHTEALKHWKPKVSAPAPSLNFLDHIEGMLVSMVKRGRAKQLQRFDFAVGYHNGTEWKAYYPTLDALLEHHLNKQEQSQEYLDFLRSEELEKKRAEWDQESPNAVEFPKQ